MRTVHSLDEDWQFIREDVGLDAAVDGGGSWEAVTLPHTWNAADGHTGGNDYHRGACWYRRPLDVGPSTADRRAFVEFGAAGMVAEVYVGGTKLAHHRGGYSIFRADVTEQLDAEGRGTLTVRVDNSQTTDVYPLMGDHTMFGGLYRSARLIEVPNAHLDLLDDGSPGVALSQTALDDETGTITATVRVTNDGSQAAALTVAGSVSDGGATVAIAEAPAQVAAGDTAEVDLTLSVSDPHRWDGLDDPFLYDVTVSLGEGADEITLPFGLRTFEVDPETGPVLNGRPYRLHGASRHHDFEGKGPALLPADHDTDLAIFQELGVNAIRLAHYQHDQYFYDLCDRAGIAVWAEIPFNAQAAKEDPHTNAVEQMTDLIKQCMHHPAIVCWGVQNEITLGEASRDPRPTVERLAGLVRELDPTRPTVQANLGQVTGNDPIIDMTDLNSMNLYNGWYYDTAESIGDTLDSLHAANPAVPLGLSEYGADTFVGYHADEPRAGDYTEEYQAHLHEVYWHAVEARSFMWSSFVWNMFDFASDLRSEGGKSGRNMKGLVTYDRKTRKDAFWWYKANWSDEPFVHICSKRFVNRDQPTITVKAYSNQSDVRLEVDGKDVGIGEGPDHIFTWQVDLSEGETTVQAVAGDETDAATFVKVTEPDESYICPKPSEFGAGGRLERESWYEKEGLEADPSLYSTWTPLGDLLDNPETRAVLGEVIGEAMFEDDRLELARGFTIDFLSGFVPEAFTDEKLRELHDRLSVIPKV